MPSLADVTSAHATLAGRYIAAAHVMPNVRDEAGREKGGWADGGGGRWEDERERGEGVDDGAGG
jgi:hypothetical protein